MKKKFQFFFELKCTRERKRKRKNKRNYWGWEKINRTSQINYQNKNKLYSKKYQSKEIKNRKKKIYTKKKCLSCIKNILRTREHYAKITSSNETRNKN